ncbi:MAG: putative phage tail protein [Pseudomonadota bacterium]
MTYSDLLKLLLPSSFDANGRAINAELAADGNALDLAQFWADQILVEADPRTANLTLADWERIYGLPTTCIAATGVAQSTAERRTALLARITMQGGQSRAYFIALAASMGYTISITEGYLHTTEMDSEDPVTDEQYRFIWYVNSPLNTVRELTTEDDTEMATAVWGNTLLECTINQFKPAHTLALFSYS